MSQKPLHLGVGICILSGMGFDLVQIRGLAQQKADENWRFREFLKGQSDLEPDELDRHVFETSRRVWAGIDGTSCANCCRQVKRRSARRRLSGWRGVSE